MKVSDMNKHERLAFEVVKEVMSDYIGGYENTLLDYKEETEEYQAAKRFLSTPHDEMKEFLYSECMKQIENTCGGFYKNAKFAGKEFILERIEKRLVKWGY